MDINVGDIVYYSIDATVKRYCRVYSIEDNRVWGNWCDSLEEALSAKPHTGTYKENYNGAVTLVKKKQNSLPNYRAFLKVQNALA